MSSEQSKPGGRRILRWAYLGGAPYAPTAALQERIREEIHAGTGDEHLLLLEHDPPVYTLGRNASREDVVAGEAWRTAQGIEVHETNRGGQVTYHGPGQLVGYPILDLDPDRRDVRRYVQDIQRVLILTLADFGVEAHPREGREHIGVWVGEEKIASIGVHLSRWITIHGFALNVTTDLAVFGGIIACGLPSVRMTSLEQQIGRAVPLAEVARRAAAHLITIFGREPVEEEASELIRRSAEALREREEKTTRRVTARP